MMAIFGVLLILCSHADRPSQRRHDLSCWARPGLALVYPGIPGDSSPIPDPSREIVSGEIEPFDDEKIAGGSSLPLGVDLVPRPSGLRFHPSPVISSSLPPRTFFPRLRC